MIRNLIWDVDGTLFDTYPAIELAFQAAAGDLGAQVPRERIAELVQVSLDHCLEVLAATCRLSAGELETAFASRYAARSIHDSPPFPGVIDVCRRVRAIGGINVIVTHRRRSSTEALLVANGMDGLFAGLLTAEEGYPRKPDPAMFLAALDAHALVPAETMGVGDRALDVEGARAAGLAACLFAPQPRSIPADLVVASFAELERFLADAAAATAAAGDAGSA